MAIAAQTSGRLRADCASLWRSCTGPPEVREHPVYTEWVRFFGRSEYSALVAKTCADFEHPADEVTEATIARLSSLFTTSVRLERGFWDIAYGTAHEEIGAY